MFLLYKESYERLKLYLKYKEELLDLEKNVTSENGNITFSFGKVEYSEIFQNQDTKAQYIKTLRK
jgi:hypothetical protein